MKAKHLFVLPVLLLLQGCLSYGLSDALGVPTEGVIAADYKDDEQVRVASNTMQRFEDPFPVAFERVVEMVGAKGYDRFALIRRRCESSVIQPTGTFAGTSCILWAQMLTDGGTAEPKGSNDEVVYYRISEDGEAIPEQS